MKSQLAVKGGNPIRTKPFPSWPRPTEIMKEHLIRTLEQEAWGIGSSVVEKFEKSFAEFHDAKYAISTNSGTAALWIALKAAGVKAGDEIIIPAYTFVATASSVLMANAIPVFVDINEETFNIEPDAIEASITGKTKVIMPVHIAGNPADISKIRKIADKYKIPMIEDAAQAHGSEWQGRKVGAFGLGGIFSFQSSKNMTAGEGGAILSDDEEFISACFSYQNVGRVKEGKWYQHERLGGNFRLSAFPAALLLAQIEMLETDMKIRDSNVKLLDQAIDSIEGLTIIKSYPETTRISHHLYIFRYHKENFHGIAREEFLRTLCAEGIPAYSGYVPLYKENLFITNEKEYPWLKNRNYHDLYLPVTEKIANEEAVWIKQNCLLGSEEDTMDIVKAIQKVTNHFVNT